MGGVSGLYGIVRLRVVFDANREGDFIVYQVFDPAGQGWVEIPKDVAEDIAERSRLIGGGLLPNGMQLAQGLNNR